MQNSGPHTEEVEIDPKLSTATQKQIIAAERENAKQGRMVGLLILLVGVVLLIVGVSGVVDVTLEGMGLKAKAAKAAPGVVLGLIGLVVIWRTNLSIKSAKK